MSPEAGTLPLESSVSRPEVLLRLHRADTVAVATVDLIAGATAASRDGDSVVVRSAVPAGHKVALVDIGSGDSVIKFGVDIGTASSDVAAGSHVHVHNLESERMRGDRA